MTGIIRKQNAHTLLSDRAHETAAPVFPIMALPTELFTRVIANLDFKETKELLLASKSLTVRILDTFISLYSTKETTLRSDLAQKIEVFIRVRNIYISSKVSSFAALPPRQIQGIFTLFHRLTEDKKNKIQHLISTLSSKGQEILFKSAAHFDSEQRAAIFRASLTAWINGWEHIAMEVDPSVRSQELKNMPRSIDSYPTLQKEMKKLYFAVDHITKKIEHTESFIMAKLMELDENTIDSIATDVKCKHIAHLIPLVLFCKNPHDSSLFPKVGKTLSVKRFHTLCLAKMSIDQLDATFSSAIEKSEIIAVRAMISGKYYPSLQVFEDALFVAIEIGADELVKELLMHPEIPLATIEEAIIEGAQYAEYGNTPLEIIRMLFAYSSSISPKTRGKALVEAAKSLEIAFVQAILESGDIPDKYRWRAVVSAVSVNDMATMKLLQGRDPFNLNYLDECIRVAIDNGCTQAFEHLLHIKGTPSEEERISYIRSSVKDSWQKGPQILKILCTKGPVSKAVKLELIEEVSKWSTTIEERHLYLQVLEAAEEC